MDPITQHHTFVVKVETKASEKKCREQIEEGLSHVKEGIDSISVLVGGELHTPELMELIAWLSEDIPELRTVEITRLDESLDRFLLKRVASPLHTK